MLVISINFCPSFLLLGLIIFLFFYVVIDCVINAPALSIFINYYHLVLSSSFFHRNSIQLSVGW